MIQTITLVVGDTKDLVLQCKAQGGGSNAAYSATDTLSATVAPYGSTVVLFEPTPSWFTNQNTQTGYDQGQVTATCTNAQMAMLVPSNVYTLTVSRQLGSAPSRTEKIARARLVIKQVA
jgi:hypothetical protein